MRAKSTLNLTKKTYKVKSNLALFTIHVVQSSFTENHVVNVYNIIISSSLIVAFS